VYSWQRDSADAWHYTLFIENGRVADSGDRRLLSGLRRIAEVHRGEFRLTPNQNLAISSVRDEDRGRIDALLAEFGIENTTQAGALRLNAMACVAFPTCGLAMAESERYLPSLVDRLEQRLRDVGLGNEPITIRMTGCPTGCARPYISEIGLGGKGPGTNTLYLGGGLAGERLGCLYRENIGEADILAALQPLFESFASARFAGEHFGDFLVRTGVVREVTAGRHFHAPEAARG
jgi:sulfite reductase (NADPH) hemoprotein beta-component